MNRSRFALGLLMTGYAMSLLAVGYAEDSRPSPESTSESSEPLDAAPSLGSGLYRGPVRPFTYYGPEDVLPGVDYYGLEESLLGYESDFEDGLGFDAAGEASLEAALQAELDLLNGLEPAEATFAGDLDLPSDANLDAGEQATLDATAEAELPAEIEPTAELAAEVPGDEFAYEAEGETIVDLDADFYARSASRVTAEMDDAARAEMGLIVDYSIDPPPVPPVISYNSCPLANDEAPEVEVAPSGTVEPAVESSCPYLQPKKATVQAYGLDLFDDFVEEIPSFGRGKYRNIARDDSFEVSEYDLNGFERNHGQMLQLPLIGRMIEVIPIEALPQPAPTSLVATPPQIDMVQVEAMLDLGRYLTELLDLPRVVPPLAQWAPPVVVEPTVPTPAPLTLADLLRDPTCVEGHEWIEWINLQNDGLTRLPRIEPYAEAKAWLVEGWQAGQAWWLTWGVEFRPSPVVAELESTPIGLELTPRESSLDFNFDLDF